MKEGKDIITIAQKIGLQKEDLILYGDNKAKIKTIKMNKKGHLILITATNPTPFGEGKTTVSIGLNDAFHQIGINSIAALREPSMGPVFGIKGGATGGGQAQVIPADEINLHFTGDFHAITTANNLICAMIDNSLKQGNPLNLDINQISFKRCLDMNDRSLREIEIGLGGSQNGMPRKDGFTITAASEIMAIICLATDIEDLRRRLDKIIIGKDVNNQYIYLKELEITSALLAILKDAIKPNLVQSLEENPIIIHGGPFANIAHGCSSIIATRYAQTLSDYVIEEAGFGADLGGLKFLDIKCRKNNLNPLGIVIVTTLRSLKYNGGSSVEEANQKNIDALKKGLSNIDVHLKNMSSLNPNIIVTLNKFDDDSETEINIIKEHVENKGFKFIVNEVYQKGGSGAIDLAKEILNFKEVQSKELYTLETDLKTKIETICFNVYNASEIEFSDIALSKLETIKEPYPICIAKTQYSISDNPKLLGNPINHTMHIKDITLYNGAEIITVVMGNIMTMPGLGKKPGACNIAIDQNENISGII